MRITVTIPQNLVAGAKYEAWVWWRDDPDRDLGKVPLAFVWSNNDDEHTNVGGQFPDDNVRSNQITSVRVPPGWRLELYDSTYEGGKKLVFQGIDDANIYNNKNFNDITSSLCVFTPAQQAANGEFGDWTGADE